MGNDIDNGRTNPSYGENPEWHNPRSLSFIAAKRYINDTSQLPT